MEGLPEYKDIKKDIEIKVIIFISLIFISIFPYSFSFIQSSGRVFGGSRKKYPENQGIDNSVELQNFVGLNSSESRKRGEKQSLLGHDDSDSSNTDNDSDTETLLRM